MAGRLGVCLSNDESAWIKVPEEFITRNTNVNLEFYLPRDIETGKNYFLAVRTSIRGNRELKSAITGYSKREVTVEE